MRTVLTLAALALGLVGVASPAYAVDKPPQTKPNPKAQQPKPKAAPERDLKMNQGTAEAGGSITLDINSGGGSTQVGANISPMIGYFVADKFEVIGGLGLDLIGGSTTWSVQAGGRIFIDMGDPWAYLGLMGGYGQTSFNASAGGVSVSGSSGAGLLTIPAGVMVPLAKNVGLDLGARVNMSFAGGGTFINIPIGYLGVTGFFKP